MKTRVLCLDCWSLGRRHRGWQYFSPSVVRELPVTRIDTDPFLCYPPAHLFGNVSGSPRWQADHRDEARHSRDCTSRGMCTLHREFWKVTSGWHGQQGLRKLGFQIPHPNTQNVEFSAKNYNWNRKLCPFHRKKRISQTSSLRKFRH